MTTFSLGSNMNNFFHRFSKKAADLVGSVHAFIAALLLVLIWLLSGPYFHFSDTWQLIINTGTTVITFLIVFLIQNTQNRQSRMIEIKIDELIKAIETARNFFIDLDELSDEELERLQQQFKRIANHDRIKNTSSNKKKD